MFDVDSRKMPSMASHTLWWTRDFEQHEQNHLKPSPISSVPPQHRIAGASWADDATSTKQFRNAACMPSRPCHIQIPLHTRVGISSHTQDELSSTPPTVCCNFRLKSCRSWVQMTRLAQASQTHPEPSLSKICRLNSILSIFTNLPGSKTHYLVKVSILGASLATLLARATTSRVHVPGRQRRFVSGLSTLKGSLATLSARATTSRVHAHPLQRRFVSGCVAGRRGLGITKADTRFRKANAKMMEGAVGSRMAAVHNICCLNVVMICLVRAIGWLGSSSKHDLKV